MTVEEAIAEIKAFLDYYTQSTQYDERMNKALVIALEALKKRNDD